jgi:hypothetical protein
MQLTPQQRKVTIPAPSLDVRPSQASRNTGSNVSSGPSEPGEQAERKESFLHQLDSSREINTTRPLAQQVDSARPSTSSPPSNRPSAPSTSPPPPLPAPASTEITSGRVHATGSMHTDGSQAQSGGAPLDLPHHRGEERGKTPPDGQSHTSHSATPSRLPPPADERAAAATESVSQSLPVSAPRGLDKSVSRRGAKRATEGMTSDKMEQKRVAQPEEYETRAEDFATGSDGSKRRNAGLNPPTSNTLNVIQDTNASDQRTNTSNPGNGNVSSASHLSETGKSRGKSGQPSDSTPSLGIKETLFTTSTSSATTPNQPKAPSNGDAIVSRVEQKPQRAGPPSVADPQIKSIPSSESPSFLTSLRSTSDSLLLSLSQVSPTVAGSLINQGGHVPGFLTKTEQREENATAALEGRYHSEPFIGKSHVTFSKFPPGPSGVKQRSALINNDGKFQVGSLNRGYSP